MNKFPFFKNSAPQPRGNAVCSYPLSFAKRNSKGGATIYSYVK